MIYIIYKALSWRSVSNTGSVIEYPGTWFGLVNRLCGIISSYCFMLPLLLKRDRKKHSFSFASVVFTIYLVDECYLRIIESIETL